MRKPDIIRVSERALALGATSPAEAQLRAQALAETGLFQDVVPGLGDVTAIFDPLATPPDEALAALERERATERPDTVRHEEPPVDIPVRYGGSEGPDAARICEEKGLTLDQLAAIHSSVIYTVDMIGFVPGFAYLGGLPEDLSAERLPSPRRRVEAGSIGISGAFTGIYALAVPGGWPLIGRTDARLFDPYGDVPFRLRPGQRVRFVPT